YFTDDHDFRLLPNGHALVIAYDARTMNMRTVTGDSGAAQQATVIGGIIQELDGQKNVVCQWKTWDHLPITDIANFDLKNPNHTLVDYAHLNSVEMDTDGNVIASFRSMDDIVKIKWGDTIGRVLWRWGGKDSTINFFHFTGADTILFSSQHDVRRIANGHITMWDNGNYHKTIWSDNSIHDTTYSRAIEYELDENNLEAREVWEYTDIPFSFASGNVQRLPNGNTFIGLGTVNVPNAVEVDPSGKKVFQLSLPSNPYNYRTFRFEWPQKSLVIPTSGLQHSFEISGVYPNPALRSATISFTTTESGSVQVEILDVLGHPVISINEKISEAGEHSLPVDVKGLPNGVYYCKLTQNGTIRMKMLVVQK
ncbi:MAG: aryl-sulfate sulfotransferase, partial [Candidatus Kapaibacterium sp.]